MSKEYLCNPFHYVEAMRHKHPELLTDWCCNELSHVLDFSGSDGLGQILAGVIDIRQGRTFIKKFSRNKQRAGSQDGVFGAPLTEEGFCQARQLIDFLKNYITKEGIFRIPGNSERQRRLKDKINCGLLVDLENDVFTAHDVACVLKTFLGDLSEPLLTDKHYPAHVQAAGLTYQMDQVQSLTEELDRRYQAQQVNNHITALQYLFLMLPPLYFKMLKEILELLSCIAEQERLNKMSAFNLAVMFAPHILWPRYFTTDDLRDQALISKLNYGVEFMIMHFHQIFKVPAMMLKRCEQFIKRGKLYEERGKPAQLKSQDECDRSCKLGIDISAPQRPTVEVHKEQIETEAELAKLYASVQEMPSSAKKRKLMKQFARNCNMPGTPTQVKEDILLQTQGCNRRHKHVRSKSVGDTIITKKRRPAPNPPAEHDKIVQQKKCMDDVRHKVLDQLHRNYAQSCTTPPSKGTVIACSVQPRGPQSNASSTAYQKRQAPLTPKQLEKWQLGTPKSWMDKPLPAECFSVQTHKQPSDGLPVMAQESGRSTATCKKPVPTPRKRKENSQVSSTHGSHHLQQPSTAQKHELKSLV